MDIFLLNLTWAYWVTSKKLTQVVTVLLTASIQPYIQHMLNYPFIKKTKANFTFFTTVFH